MKIDFSGNLKTYKGEDVKPATPMYEHLCGILMQDSSKKITPLKALAIARNLHEKGGVIDVDMADQKAIMEVIDASNFLPVVTGPLLELFEKSKAK